MREKQGDEGDREKGRSASLPVRQDRTESTGGGVASAPGGGADI